MDPIEEYIHRMSDAEEPLLHELDRRTNLRVVQPRIQQRHRRPPGQGDEGQHQKEADTKSTEDRHTLAGGPFRPEFLQFLQACPLRFDFFDRDLFARAALIIG